MTNKIKLEIAVDNIEVNHETFSFDYVFWIDDKVVEQGQYESDHAHGSNNLKFKKELKKHYAYVLVMEEAIKFLNGD